MPMPMLLCLLFSVQIKGPSGPRTKMADIKEANAAIVAAIDLISEDNLYDNVDVLSSIHSRLATGEGAEEAQAYLEGRFEDYGTNNAAFLCFFMGDVMGLDGFVGLFCGLLCIFSDLFHGLFKVFLCTFYVILCHFMHFLCTFLTLSSSTGLIVSTFPFLDNYSHNVIGELLGQVEPDQIVVIGAHYDSRSTDTSNPDMRGTWP